MDAVALVRESRMDNWTPAMSFQGRSISTEAEPKKKGAAAVAGAANMAAAAEARKKGAAAVAGAANMAAAAEAKKKDAAAVAGAGAGNKATVAGAGNVVAQAKKKKTVRVKQAYIDAILVKYPFKPFPCDPEEIEKTIPEPKTRELLRIMTASAAATFKAIRDKDEAIIKQYYAKGYAEEEIEVSDDEEEAA